MDNESTLVSSFSSCACIISVAVLVAFAISRGGSLPGTSGPGSPIAVPFPSQKGKGAPWNIETWSNPGAASRDGNNLKVSYTKGVSGGASGTSFKANPNKKFPSNAATISYSVYFPSTFDFRKGGKAGGGFCLGNGGKDSIADDCDTGGSHSSTGGSLRVIWKENGQGAGYVYLPTQAAFGTQSKAFKDAANNTEDSGIHLFRSSGLQFKKGAWNNVSLSLRLNSPSSANGSIKLTINGTSQEIQDVVFRKGSDVKIVGVVFATFFGGSGSQYAPVKSETATFRDFKFSAA
jgi:hypothetical protein